ncbi:MAG: hypothetical protein J7L53_03205 [Deltaproteobacteria bacterium]|nr:hypothetical protein [Deltaproteobacteria bacterium]
MKKWFVAQTNLREDYIASSNLKQLGVVVYQPLMQKYVFHARKKTLKTYPLFPNYIFVHISTMVEDLHKIRWCRGVKRLLIDNYTPIPIEDEFINSLKAMENESGIIKRPVKFKSGDIVRVRSGPMKDIYGIFESWDSDEGRVRILIEMVNNRAKVILDASLLEKA